MVKDYEEVRAKVKAIVDVRLDYVYADIDPNADYGAVYFDSLGHPSCLVGHYLASEDYRPGDVIEGCVLEHQNWLRPDFTDEAWHFLQLVQDYQDSRLPWGDAYYCAERDMADDIALST